MYEEHLANKSIFFSRQTFFLLLLYFLARFLSYIVSRHEITQSILVFLLLMLLGILYFKKPEYGWYLVLGELFLGGSGHYIEFLGLPIRTLFIGFFLFLWVAQHVGQSALKERLKIDKELSYLLILFFLFLAFAIGNGAYHGHAWHQIFADSIPFSFLLLLFPSYQLFQDNRAQEFLVRLISVFVIGTALFSLFTFTIFSSGSTQINGDFYQWYRDINLGKIIDMQTGFFRIVEPEHLLITPLILLVSSLVMRAEKHNKMWRLLRWLAIVVLVLNLSRGYFLAMLAGLLVLKYKHKWRMWLKETAVVIILTAITFTGFHFLASGGQSFGLELFGLRLKSFASPQIEISTETRMMVLPEIWKLIIRQPIFGLGIGATVTFLNTATFETIATPNFDWGYLEMWVEMGIFGALLLIAVYLFVVYKLIIKIRRIPDWHDFDVGLLAGITAFLVVNITIPALFHVYAVLFLAFVIAIALKQTAAFARTTAVLYQVFNRLKS